LSDLDGDSLTLSATIGVAVNNGDGTWSWSFDTTDGPSDSQLVTITVDDENGGSIQKSFALTVNNVLPKVEAGADAAINEGGTFTGSGSFTDPGSDIWTATVDYRDGTGTQALPLTGNSFQLSQMYADNGAYTVTVSVMDDDGGLGSDTLSVTVANVAPIVNACSDQSINDGDYQCSGLAPGRACRRRVRAIPCKSQAATHACRRIHRPCSTR